MTEVQQPPTLDQVLEPTEIAGFAAELSRRLQGTMQPRFRIETSHLLAPEIAAKLKDSLHLDVLGFLAEGWNTAAALEACRTQSRNAPTATVIAKLGRHSISRELNPTITVTYGARQSFDIDAGVVFEGVFDGVELAFDDGCVTSLGSGQCELTAQLQVGGHAIGHTEPSRAGACPGDII